MNVRQLIEQLESLPQDMEVHITYDYGDHWHTQAAPSVRNIEIMPVRHSDYHSMTVIDEPADDDEPQVESFNQAIVISACTR